MLTETTKPKVLAIWHFTEKVQQPLHERLYLHAELTALNRSEYFLKFHMTRVVCFAVSDPAPYVLTKYKPSPHKVPCSYKRCKKGQGFSSITSFDQLFNNLKYTSPEKHIRVVI